VSIFPSVAARQHFAGIAGGGSAPAPGASILYGGTKELSVAVPAKMGSGNCGNLRASDDPGGITKAAALAEIAGIPMGLVAPRRTEQQRYISASYGAQLFGRRSPGSGKGANPSLEPPNATPGRATKIHNWVAWHPLIRVRKARSESACGNCANGPGPLALTPRTPIPRLPALCLSGPFRSELSARSADRGRVVPVLDRLSGRSSIAPFAPSFP
jgi:hypothetical protein